YEHDDASLIRVTRRDFERLIHVPPEFTARMNTLDAKIYQAWSEARPANDFKRLVPLMEKNLDLSRELANYFPGYEHIADPLIDEMDYGMKATSVRLIFNDLRAALGPIVKAILAQPPADDACLRRYFPEAEQLAFSEEVIRRMGYDFTRGRVDQSPHPFTTSFSPGDVRITTRVNEIYLVECLFSDIHEAGHAMYEQGVDMKYDGTPLASGTSAGVHESQSRLWEYVVGHSLDFWEYFYPQLQKAFPTQFSGVPLEAFYRLINKVERSLIRTEADEVTYDLHVMLRFELELALLEGTLAIKDLPEAWNARYQADLGITPPDDRDGVLQDVHWYGGPIGGSFQGYTLGNIMSAQFYAEALKAHPEIPLEMRRGEFSTLHNWLIDNIYRHGRKFTAPELLQRITGGDLSIEPYLSHLRTKYGQLYTL
ncbi:MAG TPA: carboxypeptidase M32, partial [Anaerolineales bacterium]|nr:carboxypeptidase M32 [Anaerolineales bacterium]